MLKKLLFKWFMNAKAQNLDYVFDRMVERIEAYHLVDSPDILKGKGKVNKNRMIFKFQSGDKTSYNIFYNNLQVRIENSPREKVYSVHIKKQEDTWQFEKDAEGNYDFSHPVTSTFRVFIAYDVPVLNITRTRGEAYSHGTWDEYVYRATEELERDIYNCTDEAQFNKCYECEKNGTSESAGTIQIPIKAVITEES